MSVEKKRWWETVPALIAAIAALLTAITGLYVAVARLGPDLGIPREAPNHNQEVRNMGRSGSPTPNELSVSDALRTHPRFESVVSLIRYNSRVSCKA
jgi:hypothetical protein